MWLEAIGQPINQCLELVGWGKIEYDLAAEEVTAFNSQKGILPVSLLSDGIRTMLGLVADIAYRIVKLNPHLGINAARETTGIVLIDEVDMHLHPEWQQVVLLNLIKAFPKLQFIVTTHSPQVLTTVQPQCIREINWIDGKPEVSVPSFALGAKSSQLLEDILKVPSRPPLDPTRADLSITEDLKRYFVLIDKDEWDTPEALELRRKLNAWGHGNEPELVRADTMIRFRKYNRTLLPS